MIPSAAFNLTSSRLMQQRRNEEMLKMKELADLYGSHLPMRLMTERNIMAQCGTRLHGSSYHGTVLVK